MSRIQRLTTRAGLSTEQQTAFDAIAASRGGVRGPFQILLHRPEVASGADKVGGYLRYHSMLSPAVRESVTLMTARLMDAEVPWTAHHKLATDAGVDATTIEHIRGLTPEAIPGELGVAVQFAHSLIKDRHIPADLFNRASSHWSSDELVDLVSLIGYYCFLAIVLNAFDEVIPPRIRGT